jgi:hypothetical protein
MGGFKQTNENIDTKISNEDKKGFRRISSSDIDRKYFSLFYF